MLVDELIAFAASKAAGRKIKDVRAGLGYTCVMLEDRASGLAYTFRNEMGQGCSVLSDAGRLIGRDAGEILSWAKQNPLCNVPLFRFIYNTVVPVGKTVPEKGKCFTDVDHWNGEIRCAFPDGGHRLHCRSFRAVPGSRENPP